ncbi:MAG TPA: TetR/AcrR family transcriptional regulator, partial [Acidimicrobiia bacterium]|nr:TetR/AcrR family transcriptional regulator [Acidimicrobiia bacterium]
MKRKLTPRGRERRQQILDQAARLFAERGYDPTSVAEIVDSLGVGKGVFYWYFESKEDLFLEILGFSSHDLRRRQQADIGDEPDPLRRIELGIRASLQWFREHRHLFNLSQFAATEGRFAAVVRQNDAVAIDDITRHLKEAMA